MKLFHKMTCLALTITCLTLALPAGAADRAAKPAEESKQEHDARMKWWREARFGMFIHWGVYSVVGSGEWVMNYRKTPVAEYAALAKQFNPVKFDADEWVRTAKEAGMKYIVITSKHHDGFAMFRSKVSPFNIYDATPFKRDPLAELAAACKKQGIRLGFYYSQAQDWHHPGGAARGGHWDKAQDGDMMKYVETIVVPQVREILSNYGDDTPAVLWWDTPYKWTPEMSEKLRAVVYECKPSVIVNSRGGYRGDFDPAERQIPATRPKTDWENCDPVNGSWGFNGGDKKWKSTETLVRNLAECASKGGNYLLNVGPTPEGQISQPAVQRLAEMGRWLKVNGEAIYGTTAGPLFSLPWGRATKKVAQEGTTLYLHVFNWPADGKLLVPDLENKVVDAWLLADKKSLTAANSAGGVVIDVPPTAPDPIDTVVVLRIAGEVAEKKSVDP